MNAYAGNGTLSSYDDVLDAKYGKKGTPEREEFHRQAVAYYMGEVLQEARKEEHITQTELARRTGTSKSYISRIENGLIDPTISSFMRIVDALGLRFELTRTIG
ncbi:MAG: helix-turn-helix transcriptional regulator [Paludibacteraceae bacterium]|nr:helix-turn-helix transcriptional regulator [Paludibacteraceae bacterium]